MGLFPNRLKSWGFDNKASEEPYGTWNLLYMEPLCGTSGNLNLSVEPVL